MYAHEPVERLSAEKHFVYVFPTHLSFNADHTRLARSEPITIVAGKGTSETPFKVPKDIISYYSPYFSTCFKNKAFKEAQLGILEWPDEPPAFVQVLVEYLLDENVEFDLEEYSRSTFGHFYKITETAVEFLLFCDRYDLGSLSAAVAGPRGLGSLDEDVLVCKLVKLQKQGEVDVFGALERTHPRCRTMRTIAKACLVVMDEGSKIGDRAREVKLGTPAGRTRPRILPIPTTTEMVTAPAPPPRITHYSCSTDNDGGGRRRSGRLRHRQRSDDGFEAFDTDSDMGNDTSVPRPAFRSQRPRLSVPAPPVPPSSSGINWSLDLVSPNSLRPRPPTLRQNTRFPELTRTRVSDALELIQGSHNLAAAVAWLLLPTRPPTKKKEQNEFKAEEERIKMVREKKALEESCFKVGFWVPKNAGREGDY